MLTRLSKILPKGIILSLCLLLSVLNSGCHINKQDTPDNHHFIYDISGGEVTILGYSGIDTEITIPSQIDGHPVTKIGKKAFIGCSDLQSVTLPDTMEDISEAFCNCIDLTTVALGSGVKKINGSFSGCTGLKTVSGGNAVTEMDYAFDGCELLSNAPQAPLCQTANYAFRGCRSLTEVDLSSHLTSLYGTFTGCSHLEGIAIPSSVTTLERTFENCSGMKTVAGGENVSIYRSAFVGCTSLSQLTISDKATVIEDCFTGCISLAEIDGMPDALMTYTPSYNGCRTLAKITIPKITDENAASDFSLSNDCRQCQSVQSITVLTPFSVNEEFCKLFAGCEKLTEINLPDALLDSLLRVAYDYSDGLYEGDDKNVLSALDTAIKTANVRVTENYGSIEGKSYTHIYGCDVADISPDTLAKQAKIVGFAPFESTSYWCGYPEDSNRKDGTAAIERTYRFFLRTTGRNDGTLPETLLVNGMTCTVGQDE